MDRTGRWLFAAFAATILCFIGSTILVETSELAIDRAALAIAGNASPSIQHLAAARAEMRHLEVLLEDAADRIEHGRGAELSALRDSRDEIQREIDGYRQLATLPG